MSKGYTGSGFSLCMYTLITIDQLIKHTFCLYSDKVCTRDVENCNLIY